MALGFIPFVVGLLGLVAYLVFRYIEIQKEIRLFEKERTRLDSFSNHLYRLFVFGDIPVSYRIALIERGRKFLHGIIVVLVSRVRSLERILSRINHRMRVTHKKETELRDPSVFLKTISESKEKEKVEGEKGDGKNTPSSV